MSNNQAKHTPGEWVIERETWHDYRGHNICAGGNIIAATDCADAAEVTPEEEANARRIVQCVNAHDGLVAALESAELSCTQARLAHGIGKKTKQQQIDFLIGQFKQLATECRAAINKAKGE